MNYDKHSRSSREGIEVFVQVEGRAGIAIVKVGNAATVRDLLDEIVSGGLLSAENRPAFAGWLEDAEVELHEDDPLFSAGIKHRCRVHFHRCRRVAVSVHFNGEEKKHAFSPAATISAVTKWAVGVHGFRLTPTDAAEHVLQISGSSDRPDEDSHLGTLVHAPACAASFDLVPKRRVEG